MNKEQTNDQANEASDTTAEPVEQPIEIEHRAAIATLVVDKYAKWSFGVGLIPVPVVDLVALTGVQMKMIDEISKVYGESFSEHKLRSTIGSLLGAALPQSVGRTGVSSLIKSIPVFGSIVGMVTMPAMSAAATYAIGTLFVKHFESGGTFLNLDIKSMTAQVKDIAAKYRKKKDTDVDAEQPTTATA